jgi:glycosyltransferase involved in cell wall biosynthesis
MSRIIYFSSDYSPHDYRFLAALSGTEHEVYYLRLGNTGRPTEGRPLPSRIHPIPWAGGQTPFTWRGLPRLTQSLRQVVRKIKPDLIHAGPIQTCAFLAVLSGFRPVLTMSWGFDLMQDADRNSWWRWVTRYTLRHTTLFTSDAEITREKAIAHGMDPNRTVVFAWGVELDAYRMAGADDGGQAAAVQPVPPDAPAAGFILFCNRSWEPRYGVDVLAQAFVKAAKQCRNISLLLLGDGSQASMIRRILEGGGVADRVKYIGRVPRSDLPRYYQMADLYVSASHIDGSSVSLMEAMACGLPCLVSDIPANREWVNEGVNGWLFPDGSVDQLAAAILRVHGQRNDLASIKQAARRTAEQKADWRTNFQTLLRAYDQAISLHSSA